jgi:hypothetical protein
MFIIFIQYFFLFYFIDYFKNSKMIKWIFISRIEFFGVKFQLKFLKI